MRSGLCHYTMLDTVVAMEAILLASFILMRQTRAGRRTDEREHLLLLGKGDHQAAGNERNGGLQA